MSDQTSAGGFRVGSDLRGVDFVWDQTSSGWDQTPAGWIFCPVRPPRHQENVQWTDFVNPAALAEFTSRAYTVTKHALQEAERKQLDGRRHEHGDEGTT